MPIVHFTLRFTIAVFTVVLAIGCGRPGSVDESTSALRRCPPSNPDCGVPPPGDPEGDPAECLRQVQANFYASPSTIALGQSTTLVWGVVFPSNCAVEGSLTLSSQPVAAEGFKKVAPLADLSYYLRIGTTPIATAPVRVTLPQTVRITQNTGEQRRLLVQAVGTPGTQVLLVDGLDMDLTGFADITIRENVTLRSELPITFEPMFSKEAPTVASEASERVSIIGPPYGLPIPSPGPVARSPHRLGPRLYTTSRPRPLFVVSCYPNPDWANNVRISGFRLQGPHWDTEEGDDNLERAIAVNSCRNVEISNMEISGWSGAAVRLEDSAGRLSPEHMVRVQDNFLHHNQHAGGFGYGVDVGRGAYADIQRNVFDFNRHAIAASGEAGTGYRAERNLILKGGGHHDRWYRKYTHQVDVHGDEDCLFEGPYGCGNAGEQFWINYNSFQYTNGVSIKIRGTPRVFAEISANVFARGLMEAVSPMGGENMPLQWNRWEVDPYGKYGVCDFDGDGKDDLFLATGATWWYSSGGRMHWSFLNAAAEQLHEVGLGDFDGDGKCDVFTVHETTGKISSGGRGFWTAVPGTFPMPFEQLRFGNFAADARTDIFWRRPDTEWHVIAPGIQDWTPIQSDPTPLEGLRFGDFNGNGLTDVMTSSNGRWSVSWDARSDWSWLNVSLTSDLPSLLIGNVDGLLGDDIVRWVAESSVRGHWEMSAGGTGPWTALGTLDWEDSYLNNEVIRPAQRLKGFVGRFDTAAGADVLSLDAFARSTRIGSNGREPFTAHSLFPY